MSKLKDSRLSVSTSKLSKTLGITTRWVRDLAEAGVLRRVQRGTFDLAESTCAYVAYLKRQNKNGDSSDGRDRLVQARANLLELRLAKERGEVLPLSLYRSELFRILNSVRERILRISGQVSAELVGLDAGQIQDALDRVIREALTDLARGNHARPVPADPDDGKGEADLPTSCQ